MVSFRSGRKFFLLCVSYEPDGWAVVPLEEVWFFPSFLGGEYLCPVEDSLEEERDFQVVFLPLVGSFHRLCVGGCSWLEGFSFLFEPVSGGEDFLEFLPAWEEVFPQFHFAPDAVEVLSVFDEYVALFVLGV